MADLVIAQHQLLGTVENKTMAIQTSGFQASVMPTYTPVNPSLVAFNPSQISDGMLQAFNVAKALEELKAKKALQQEFASTMQKRIEAQNAQNALLASKSNEGLRLVTPEADLRLGQIGAESSLLGPETEAKRQSALFSAEKNKAFMPNLGLLAQREGQQAAADISTIQPITAATIAEAQAKEKEAQSSVALAALKRQSTAAQLEMGRVIAVLNATNAPDEALFRAVKTANALASAQTDEEHRKALQAADLELKKSQAIENRAQADYALGLGRQAFGKPMTPEQEAKRLQDLIKELDNMKVGDGVRTLGVYMSDTFNDDGTVKGDKWMGLQPNKTRDPVGDFYLRLRQTYQQQLLQLGEQIQSQDRTQKSLPATGAGPKPTSRLPKVGDVVNGYIYKGGNPNDKSSWQRQ